MKTYLLTTVLLLQIGAAYGAMALNPDVKQSTIDTTICVPGYASKVRPSTVYTNGVKKKLMTAKGLSWDTRADYELDHVVPLSSGGHPRSLDNLRLQPWEGADGAKEKDKLEVRLQKMICTKKITLKAAQSCIYNNWQACAKKYPK